MAGRSRLVHCLPLRSYSVIQEFHQPDVRFFSPPPSPIKNSVLEPETFAKSPFIIGVAGGTASGKVSGLFNIKWPAVYFCGLHEHAVWTRFAFPPSMQWLLTYIIQRVLEMWSLQSPTDVSMQGYCGPAGPDRGQLSREAGGDGQPGLLLSRAHSSREGSSCTWRVQL